MFNHTLESPRTLASLTLLGALLVGSSPASALSVADQFTSPSFDNDDGTTSWSTPWIEDDPQYGGDGPEAGQIQVRYGELRLDDRPNTYAIPSATRGVDLATAETAILSFDFRTHSGVDTGDAIELEISADGGSSFFLLERIDGIAGAINESRQYDISTFASSDTALRYRVARGYGGRYERFYVDNVVIEFTLSSFGDNTESGDDPEFGDDPAVDPPDYNPQDPRVQVTHKVTAVDADTVHATGNTGQGITIAFVDTGNLLFDEINRAADGHNRILANYDAIQDSLGIWVQNDGSGHGTHVITTAISSYNTSPNGPTIFSPDSYTSDNTYNGMAPGADLVVVKAFDAQARAPTPTSFADRLDRRQQGRLRHPGAQSLVQRPAQSYYWDDPLNQAVMAAWQAGIVVVASAGNLGPDPMTIGVPGNVPYVITVGAMSDNFTPRTAATTSWLPSPRPDRPSKPSSSPRSSPRRPRAWR